MVLKTLEIPPKPRKLPEKDDLPKCRITLACENIRFSSLFAAGDVSFSAAKSEEKLMFSQARITFTMTALDTVVPFYRNECWKYMSRLWAYDSLVVLVVLVERLCIGNKGHMQGYSRYTTDSPSSKYKHRRPLTLLHNIRNIRICMEKKPVVSVTYENERFFCHTNPHISNVMQQCWCLPMLIFRAWATCA